MENLKYEIYDVPWVEELDQVVDSIGPYARHIVWENVHGPVRDNVAFNVSFNIRNIIGSV